MAEYEANIIPLSSSVCKVHFINYDGIKTDGLTEVTYEGNTFQVTQTGVLSEGDSFNGWCLVDASFSDFDFNSRVILEVAGGGTPELGYGLLYNWYAATDVRGVAPSGFRVPSQTDFTALLDNYSGVNNLATRNALMGNRRISDGHPYWDGGGTSTDGTNSESWAFYGFGHRNGSDGNYETTISPFNATFGNWWTTSTPAPQNNPRILFLASGQGPTISSNFGSFDVFARYGYYIRCLSDTEPPTATVQDQDGNNYTWVQIGSQYWLAQNLRTTSYNNGDPIPTGLDNAAWAATTDGAFALPNGDPSLPI